MSDLRETRGVMEAGVNVEGKSLESQGSFYAWAQERYNAIEDGSDSCIGSDDS